jgi:class 3 adenylate cyclase
MVLLVVLALTLVAPPLSFIEMRALDVLYLLRPARQPDRRIEVLDIGNYPDLYEHLRDPRDSQEDGCKIPRLAYAEAVRRLSRWGARVIAFDVYFTRRCEYEDERLAAAFREAGNVVVAATTKTRPGAVGLQDPVEPLDEAVWAVGHPVAHRPNESARSIPLLVRDYDSGREYFALSLLAFQRFRGVEPTEAKLSPGGRLLTDGLRVPVLSGERIHLFSPGGGSEVAESQASSAAAIEVVRGDNVEQIPGLNTWTALLVNWVGRQGTIQLRPLREVLAIDDDEQGRELFGGKAIIIGRTGWDEWWTSVGAMPGLEIQANALNTLMSGAFIRPISPWGMLALMVAFILATASAVHRLKGARAIAAVAFLMVAAVVIARQLLVERGIWVYLFHCELGIGLTWGATVFAESGKVTGLLTRFVPSFMGRPEAPGVGEVRTMDASILFSDIRGYTGIAEKLSAVETLTMLSEYQSTVEDIITRHGGTIVKTPGDAILAVFWKDVGGLNHATCAVRSGVEILSDLPRVGQAWQAVGVDLKIGIGIDAGQVAMGLVGKRHLEPTVIGDPVNVSQRLESLTKTLGCPLIFSENVRAGLPEDVEAPCLDEVTVRGREMPLRVYGIGAPDGLCQRLEHRADSAEKEKTE